MKILIRLTVTLSLVVWFSLTASNAFGQTECPPDMVCLSREAAQAALEAGDKAKALEAQLKAEQEAKEILRKALDDMRIQFATVSGENTALRQNAVQDRAIITAMIPMLRQKVNGIKIF